MHDIIIIGAGIAGLTAAIYGRRAGLTAALLERNIFGGQMVESAEVENYPGVPVTTGPELAAAACEQADKLGAQIIYDTCTALEREADCWKIIGTSAEYRAKAVIIANGAVHRRLGCEGEERLAGRGVSYCATCDGAFFRGRDVAVVGGGNTALEDALFLANMCNKVYLIHRRDQFRGDRVLVDAVRQRENIELVMDAQVTHITGEQKVGGVEVTFRSGETRAIDLSAVFIAIGVQPDTEVFASHVSRDAGGYIIADENGETGVEGLYAAGDCRAKRLRQIVTAAADGANAAFSASNYINQQQ
ncbi:MAG: thioredoxin-disulfide reductase [Ruminococcaceae bacterium]|nr:thioredoxin-disulfide reductase [Oscillospiraceae bacterium]